MARLRSRINGDLLAALLVIGLAAPATALEIFPSELPFLAHGGGSVVLLDIVMGPPTGALTLAGTVDPLAPTVLFRVERGLEIGLRENSLTHVRVSADSAPVAAGWLPGSGVDASSANLGSLESWQIHFDPFVAPGEQSDVLFASFESFDLGDTLLFAVPVCSEPGPRAGGNGIFCAVRSLPALVIPEPSTDWLLLFGLCLLSTVVRRPRRARLGSGPDVVCVGGLFTAPLPRAEQGSCEAEERFIREGDDIGDSEIDREEQRRQPE